LQLTNEQTKHQGNLRMLLNVPDFKRSGLKMSSVILADLNVNERLLQLEGYEQSMAGNLIPNIKREFKKDRPIVVYFEVYNLRLGRREKTAFTVKFRIRQINIKKSALTKFFNLLKNIFKKDESFQITVEDDYSGERSDEYISRSIVLSENNPGEYELEIIVKDQISWGEVTKTIDFEIVN